MIKNLSAKEYSKEEVIEFLREIEDPEIPVINIVELGVIRDVEISEEYIQINITPTYSGCPAMMMMESQIKLVLKEKGYQDIRIKTVLSPVWTTDFLSEEAKGKLKAYGIAPPGKSSPDKRSILSSHATKVSCPFCDSDNTKLQSQFGSTPCKSLYFCDSCHQPFEHFKCH